MFKQKNKFFFNNARNCLRVFLRTAGVREMFVPFELCSVVFKAARQENVRLKFYHIDENFMPCTQLPHDAYILYPNYFGICDGNAQLLAHKYTNFIYDATQSFFAEPLGIATIYSARKFFPVTDGGILVTNLDISQNFPKEANGEDFSTDPMNFDYEKFLRNELKFNNSAEIKLISDKSRLKLSQIDLEAEKAERTENFRRLHEQFGTINELKIPSNVTAPMVYPLKLQNPQIKNDNGIFILQYKYMKNIIPLPLNSTCKYNLSKP